MSNMKNFKEAFNGIFGTSKDTMNESVENRYNSDFQKRDSQYGNYSGQGTQNQSESFQQDSYDESEKKWTTTAIQPNANMLNERLNGFSNRESSYTVISGDTRIEGTLISNSNLEVGGTIIGDVVTTETISVSGKLKGDVKAYAIDVDGGHVVGDTKAVSSFRASEKAILSGDISCVDVEMFGKVQGNITSKRLKIHKDAVILGDINADEIAIEFGAKVKGQLNFISDVSDEDMKVEIE